MPNDDAASNNANRIRKGLAVAKKLGIRLPGEPSNEYGHINSDEIIRRLKDAERGNSSITFEIPAGSSSEQILAIIKRGAGHVG